MVLCRCCCMYITLSSHFMHMSCCFMCTDDTVSHSCFVFYDLSPSVQGHLISLKYLQQASGPDHHFIPCSSSIPSSHQPSLSPCVVKVKSNWILPSPVFPLGSACMFVCSHIHPRINKTCISMSAFYQRPET